MVNSADVDKVIRRVIYPTLRHIGFTKIRGRNAWRYVEDGVWVFTVRSVGNYFAAATGFPPQSLTAWLGAYFYDFPVGDNPATASVPKTEKDGLIVPREYECHVRYPLQVMEDQTELRTTVHDKLGRRRDDIWWIAPNGGNIEDAVSDINRSIVEFGVPHLDKQYNTRTEQIRRRGLIDPRTT